MAQQLVLVFVIVHDQHERTHALGQRLKGPCSFELGRQFVPECARPVTHGLHGSGHRPQTRRDLSRLQTVDLALESRRVLDVDQAAQVAVRQLVREAVQGQADAVLRLLE